MKAWLIRRTERSSYGWIGNVYETLEAAKADNVHNESIIEIEIPDPPHVWKVGDWFIPSNPFTWDTATRICDMTADGRWSGITRWQDDDPRGVDGWTVDGLARGAIPCDPPDWWEGDR